jgi:hypothetical protein
MKHHMDINMLMGDQDRVIKLWIDTFDYPVGMYFNFRRHTLQWQIQYSGLTERNKRRISRYQQKLEEKRRVVEAEVTSKGSDTKVDDVDEGEGSECL